MHRDHVSFDQFLDAASEERDRHDGHQDAGDKEERFQRELYSDHPDRYVDKHQAHTSGRKSQPDHLCIAP